MKTWGICVWFASCVALAQVSCTGQNQGLDGVAAQSNPISFSPLVPAINMDMEGTDVAIVESAGVFALRDDGKELPFDMYGTGGAFDSDPDKPYISSSQPLGGHSLQLTLKSRLQGAGPDVVGVVLNQEGDEGRFGIGFNFDKPKYFGFMLLVHPTSGLPLAMPVRIFQVSQVGVPINPGSPVDSLVARIEGGADGFVQLTLSIRDNLLGERPIGQPRALSIGDWHNIVFFLHPNSNDMPGKGVVTVWVNGTQLVDAHTDWGLNVVGQVRDEWRIRLGMYRAGSTAINQRMYTFFDNIRVASSKQQADPLAF